ncbi:ABC transporter ATP-binding protein [Francisella tularensis]|uniref:ABC transporter ATP-binding protein n=1 Tax=Francisella tularensis TaxID=263 RepID=UPI00028EBA47|nr:ABC transporter ATP-binding protein [Francisella tularensis]AJI62481.1 ABC transporter family protein [Francisella tularensis subsp. tularensis]EKM90106.1 ABC transporter ATP-binding protein [Francisella tularensis subsp. tularensis 80700103]KFJ65115.1 ABC transporter family protein [Francisella tularensis]MBK2015590.1 ABC transporter ATP-binding protein [Francisella tularensis subsp. tularensis]MBK2017736.1 ABC transporter ATP-binding protein [Francisella tularensis subsp. tularensis]
MAQLKNNSLINCYNICLEYHQDKKLTKKVIENLNLSIRENEIIAIVGKSGAGKSSLVRILSGILKPTSGKLFYKGSAIDGPLENIGMVFQNFALLPWLNVLENVLFGADSLGIPRSQSKPKALEIIKKIGLNGFEDAYVSELSGGMKQRVGFARALMIEPEILFLDEPFSSLDIVTAKTLRDDIMHLWHTGETKTKAIVLVIHNIEEAVNMANRVIILDSNPGRIASEKTIELDYPRDLEYDSTRIVIKDISSTLHAINQ